MELTFTPTMADIEREIGDWCGDDLDRSRFVRLLEADVKLGRLQILHVVLAAHATGLGE